MKKKCNNPSCHKSKQQKINQFTYSVILYTTDIQYIKTWFTMIKQGFLIRIQSDPYNFPYSISLWNLKKKIEEFVFL